MKVFQLGLCFPVSQSDVMDAVDLDKFNSETVEEYFPTIVLYITVAVLGVFGNTVSFIYHGFSVPKTTVNFMMMALAMIDFSACLAISGNIVMLYRPVTFFSSVGCKMVSLVNHWLATTSGCVVFLVTIDRYKRVCTPFGWQFSLTTARVAFVCTTVVCFLLSARNVVAFDAVQKNITFGRNESALGFQCTYSASGNVQFVTVAFLYIDIVMFIILALVGCVLYSLIMRTLVISRRQVTWYQSHEEPTPSRVSTKTDSSTYSEDSRVGDADSLKDLKQEESCTRTSTVSVSAIGVENIGFVFEKSLTVGENRTESDTDKKDENITHKEGEKEEEIQKHTLGDVKMNHDSCSFYQGGEHTSVSEIQLTPADISETVQEICNKRIETNERCQNDSNDVIMKREEISKNDDNTQIIPESQDKISTENSKQYSNSWRINTVNIRRVTLRKSAHVKNNEQLMSRNERQITILFIAVMFLASISFLPSMITYLYMKETGISAPVYTGGIQTALLSYKFHNAINPYIICLLQRRFRGRSKQQINRCVSNVCRKTP